MCTDRMIVAISFFLIISPFLIHEASTVETRDILMNIRKCFDQEDAVICFKEEAIEIINHTLMSTQPIEMFDGITIEKDPNYSQNFTDYSLPKDSESKNSLLNEILYDKMEEFIKSRTLKFQGNDIIEGRRIKDRRDKNKDRRDKRKPTKSKIMLIKSGTPDKMMPMMMSMGGMIMMGGMAMVSMMAQMILGKLAFAAGIAILISKISLAVSVWNSLKTLVNNSQKGQHHGSDWDRNNLGGPYDRMYKEHVTPYTPLIN